MKLFFIILFLFPIFLTAQTITTVAGNGMPGDSGDNGPAIVAEIDYPTYVVFDDHGNYYFTEHSNRVRKVSACGIISTIAGNGTAGFSGDGGSATTAELNFPIGVAVDKIGNVYINDFNNNRIRKVDAMTGIINTYAGSGTMGYSGDGNAATSAEINGVAGVACDTFGNLFISDHGNNRIRKVDAAGIIITYAGSGTNGYSGDGGAAGTAEVGLPGGITCDRSGNVYFIEGGPEGVRKVNAATGIITTVAGNGTIGFSGDGGLATSAQFYGPAAVTVDNIGNIYIADKGNERVRKVDTSGIVNTIVGDGTAGYSGDGGPATAAVIYYPEGVACNEAGNLYIADFSNHRIRKVTYSSNDTLSIALSATPSVHIGATVTINATVSNAGSSYLIHWLNHGIEFTATTVPSVTYTKQAGIDTITARVVPSGYGCWDSTTSAGAIVMVSTEGVQFGGLTMSGVVVYPNPVTDVLHIDGVGGNSLSSGEGRGEVYKLLTIIGTVTQQGSLKIGNNSISIPSLPKGMYILEITDSKGEKFITKIVKQ